MNSKQKNILLIILTLCIFGVHYIQFSNQQPKWYYVYIILSLGVFLTYILTYWYHKKNPKQLNFGFYIGSFIKMLCSAIILFISNFAKNKNESIQFIILYLTSLFIEIIAIQRILNNDKNEK